jgi:hypothetical protein
MNSDLLTIIDNMAKMDIAKAANYKVMLAIGNHPEAYFPNPMETAAHIKMDVNEDFVNDPEFQTVVDAYVKVLSRIYDQLKRDMPLTTADRVFAIISQGLTLTYTY